MGSTGHHRRMPPVVAPQRNVRAPVEAGVRRSSSSSRLKTHDSRDARKEDSEGRGRSSPLAEDEKEIVEQSISAVKSRGHFDSLRRDFLQYMEEMSGYNKFRSNILTVVSKFLRGQQYSPALNKRDIREELRKLVMNEIHANDKQLSYVVEDVVCHKSQSRRLRNIVRCTVDDFIPEDSEVEKSQDEERIPSPPPLQQFTNQFSEPPLPPISAPSFSSVNHVSDDPLGVPVVSLAGSVDNPAPPPLLQAPTLPPPPAALSAPPPLPPPPLMPSQSASEKSAADMEDINSPEMMDMETSSDNESEADTNDSQNDGGDLGSNQENQSQSADASSVITTNSGASTIPAEKKSQDGASPSLHHTNVSSLGSLLLQNKKKTITPKREKSPSSDSDDIESISSESDFDSSSSDSDAEKVKATSPAFASVEARKSPLSARGRLSPGSAARRLGSPARSVHERLGKLSPSSESRRRRKESSPERRSSGRRYFPGDTPPSSGRRRQQAARMREEPRDQLNVDTEATFVGTKNSFVSPTIESPPQIATPASSSSSSESSEGDDQSVQRENVPKERDQDESSHAPGVSARFSQSTDSSSSAEESGEQGVSEALPPLQPKPEVPQLEEPNEKPEDDLEDGEIEEGEIDSEEESKKPSKSYRKRTSSMQSDSDREMPPSLVLPPAPPPREPRRPIVHRASSSSSEDSARMFPRRKQNKTMDLPKLEKMPKEKDRQKSAWKHLVTSPARKSKKEKRTRRSSPMLHTRQQPPPPPSYRRGNKLPSGVIPPCPSPPRRPLAHSSPESSDSAKEQKKRKKKKRRKDASSDGSEYSGVLRSRSHHSPPSKSERNS